MSAAAAPSYSSAHRASATLAVGLCLSFAIHLGVGVGASGYFGSVWSSNDSSNSQIEIEPDAAKDITPDDKPPLGMQDATAVSINWLGVIDNSVEADVPISTVEQAEFTRQIGDAPTTVSPQPAAHPISEPTPEIKVPEPIVQEEQVEIIDPIPEPEPEPVSASTEQIELEIEREEPAAVVIEPQPESVEEPAEEANEEQVEEPVDTQSPIDPEVVSVDPTPPVESVQAQPEQDAQEVAPTTAGKNGIVSKNESAASKIKRAIKVDGTKLHRPIVGKGLEITTIEPRFPASVRFTELPRNPVVMIRFNASGRVSKAYFLTQAKRIYDTGVRGVDEPLLSAIYQWRAKGKEIDALDPTDTKSFVEISMRITFRKESKEP